MPFLDSHGVGGGGSNQFFNLKKAINVFVQSSKPTSPIKGDIWVKSTETVTDIQFKENGLESPKVEGTLWVPLYDIDIKFSLEKTFKFFSNRKEIKYSHSEDKIINAINFEKVTVLKNKFVDVYSRFGAIRLFKGGKWNFLAADYWNGTEWLNFSNLDLSVYFILDNRRTDIPTDFRKVDPNTGKTVWNKQITGLRTLCVDKNSNLYVNTSSYSPSNGNIIQTHATPGNYSIVCVDPFGNVISKGMSNETILCDRDGYIYRVTAAKVYKYEKYPNHDSKSVWSANLQGAGGRDTETPAAIGKNGIYCAYPRFGSASPKPRIHKKSLQTGQLLKDFVAPEFTESDDIDFLETDSLENLYVVQGSKLYKYNSADKLVWLYSPVIATKGEISSIVVDKLGNTYMGTTKAITKINEEGKEVWSIPSIFESGGNYTNDAKWLAVEQSPYGNFAFLWE